MRLTPCFSLALIFATSKCIALALVRDVATDVAAVTCRLTTATGWAPASGNETKIAVLTAHACTVVENQEVPDAGAANTSKALSTVHAVDLPESFLREHGHELPNDSLVHFRGALSWTSEDMAMTKRLVVPEHAHWHFVEPSVRRRRLVERHTGTRKAVVVRVVSSRRNQVPADSLEMLKGRTMGIASSTWYEPINFRSQLRKCSFNKLNIVPATARDGRGISNGVVQVDAGAYDVDFTNCDILGACQQLIRDAIGSQLATNVRTAFDYVIACVPYGSTFGAGGKKDWAGFAYGGADNFVFVQSPWCAHTSSIQHEVGHLMGLGHSNFNGITRGDQTGVMGAGFPASNYATASCFNGAKYGQLGWMNDRTETLDPTRRHLVRVVAFCHYNHPGMLSTDRTLLKIGDKRVLFNRAKDFNANTGNFQNAITVTRDQGQLSDMLAGLADNPNLYYLNQSWNPYFRQATFDGVTIKMCSRNAPAVPSYAMVSVFPEGSTDLCGSAVTV